MLPTFVIGLREGLEAALIVGIIAAFLRKQGRRDLLRWVFVGVGVAIALCVAAGIALNVLSKDLPQKQQEGLETVIGVLAVGMVTYMVVWMKRHSRDLKGQLEGMAADALGGTSGGARAMIAMAFLAVLREGVETVVFLLAAFNQSTSGASAPIGAALGIAVAVLLGYGIYRGGVRINLSKFFRATGLVLVLVAAGLVVNALRTAHEAGWLEAGQGQTIDLSWLVDPGSVQASLLTGMLGLQTKPVVVEVIGWLVYLIPVGIFVAWPPGKGLARRTTARVLLGGAAALAVLTVVLAIVAPARPGSGALTRDGSDVLAATLSGDSATVTRSASVGAAPSERYQLTRTTAAERGGVTAEVYAATTTGAGGDRPRTLSWSQVADLNGGNLPIGLKATGSGASMVYRDQLRTTAWIDPTTGRVLDLTSREVVTASVQDAVRGTIALGRPVQDTTTTLPRADAADAAAAAREDASTVDRHDLLVGLAWTFGVLAGLMLLAGAGLLVTPRRRAEEPAPALDEALVKS